MATVGELLKAIRRKIEIEQDSCLYATLKRCTTDQLSLIVEACKEKVLSEWDIYYILFPEDAAENERMISAIVEPSKDQNGEKCPQCGGLTLYLMVSGVQRRAGDEAQTLVKRCTRCRHREEH